MEPSSGSHKRGSPKGKRPSRRRPSAPPVEREAAPGDDPNRNDAILPCGEVAGDLFQLHADDNNSSNEEPGAMFEKASADVSVQQNGRILRFFAMQ